MLLNRTLVLPEYPVMPEYDQPKLHSFQLNTR